MQSNCNFAAESLVEAIKIHYHSTVTSTYCVEILRYISKFDHYIIHTI